MSVLIFDGVDSLLTPNEAAEICDVAPATIRKWAQLGKIRPAGLDSQGRKLYRLGDVAEYEKKTRVRSGRARRTPNVQSSLSDQR